MAINYKKIGVKTAGVALGTVGTGMILKALPATINNLWKGAGAILLGALLPNFVKGEFVEAVASGVIAVGTQKLAQHFDFAVTGIGDAEYSVSARNNAIESANEQVAEYIAAANELEEAITGIAEEQSMVASLEDESRVEEDLSLAM